MEVRLNNSSDSNNKTTMDSGYMTDFIIESLFIAAIIGLLPAIIAKSKGRDFLTWYLYGALLFIFALPHSIFIKTPSD